MSRALSSPITTRFTQPIANIADIAPFDRISYDSLVPDRNLLHLLDATARLHPGRPALTLVHTHDQERARAESLATLPQTYRIETRPS